MKMRMRIVDGFGNDPNLHLSIITTCLLGRCFAFGAAIVVPAQSIWSHHELSVGPFGGRLGDLERWVRVDIRWTEGPLRGRLRALIMFW